MRQIHLYQVLCFERHLLVRILLILIPFLLALTLIGQTQSPTERPSEHTVKFTKEPVSSKNPCKVGELVLFEVEAMDNQGHNISYEWRDHCGSLHFIDPDKNKTIWICLDEGDWLIYVKATCEKGKSAETKFHQVVFGYSDRAIGMVTD